MVGAISASYALNTVALAVAITGGVSASLAAYAHRTKTDYTARGGALLTLLMALILTGLVGAITRSSAFEVLLAGFGAVLFGFYIIFDVQMLIGGQHSKFSLRWVRCNGCGGMYGVGGVGAVCGVQVCRVHGVRLCIRVGLGGKARRWRSAYGFGEDPIRTATRFDARRRLPAPAPRSPDDYIAGAIALYLDVINMFIVSGVTRWRAPGHAAASPCFRAMQCAKPAPLQSWMRCLPLPLPPLRPPDKPLPFCPASPQYILRLLNSDRE